MEINDYGNSQVNHDPNEFSFCGNSSEFNDEN